MFLLETLCTLAEDGMQYEREWIEEVIKTQGKDLRSPTTNNKMGRKLVPAIKS